MQKVRTEYAVNDRKPKLSDENPKNVTIRIKCKQKHLHTFRTVYPRFKGFVSLCFCPSLKKLTNHMCRCGNIAVCKQKRIQTKIQRSG